MIFLFFMETAATWIYTDLHTLPLHDALPIWQGCIVLRGQQPLLAERRAQGVAEGARESRQGLAGIAVGVLDEQRAVGRVLPRHLGAIDGGTLEDVTFSDITMRNIVNNPIFVRLSVRNRAPPDAGLPPVRRARFARSPGPRPTGTSEE